MKNNRVLNLGSFHTTYLNTAASNANASYRPQTYYSYFTSIILLQNFNNDFCFANSLVHIMEYSMHTIVNPMHTISDNMHRIDKPVHTISNNMHGIDKPMHIVVNSVHTTGNPMHIVGNNVHTIGNPMHIVDNNVHTIDNPMHTMAGCMYNAHNTQLEKRFKIKSIIKHTSATADTIKVFASIRYLTRYSICY